MEAEVKHGAPFLHGPAEDRRELLTEEVHVYKLSKCSCDWLNDIIDGREGVIV